MSAPAPEHIRSPRLYIPFVLSLSRDKLHQQILSAVLPASRTEPKDERASAITLSVSS